MTHPYTLAKAQRNYHNAVNTAIQGAMIQATLPGEILPQLTLNAREKVLVIEWRGKRSDPIAAFSHARGDGLVHLFYKGDKGYCLPPTHNPEAADRDIRCGVPFWVVNRPALFQKRPDVMAVGKIHPLHHAATYVLYGDDKRGNSGQIATIFQPDWRLTPEDLGLPDQEITNDIRRVISDEGGDVEPPPWHCPTYTGTLPAG